MQADITAHLGPGATRPDHRRAARVRVEALVEGDAQGLHFFGEATELSERGACIATPWRIALQSPVTLRLEVPRRDGRRETCVLQGSVVRQEPGRTAIAFPALKPGQMLRLRDYVWRAQKSGYAAS